MIHASTFENNLIDAVTFVVMAPINAVYGLLCLLWALYKLCAPYRRHIGQALTFAAAVAVCAAVPALAIGGTITLLFALVTMPRKAVRA